MDNIDAWMNRALETSSSSDSKKSANPQQGGKFFGDNKNKPKNEGTKTGSQPDNQQKSGKKQFSKKKKRFFSKKEKYFDKKKNSGNTGGDNKKNDPANSSKKSGKQQNSGHPQKQGRSILPPKQAKPSQQLKGKLKIIPLGGLDEVGKNMLVLEYEDDIIILDMGFEFPSEDMMGINYVIPDTSYLEANKKKIRGVVLTHGHLDHIGGIPYILPKLGYPPVYGTKLTMGLVKKRSEEFKQEKLAKFNVIHPDDKLRLGQFTCSFFRVVHSIPDSVGIVVDTPVGKIVDTGDFKFDDNPAGRQEKADIHKMEALGKQDVLALFCESTNSLKPGNSMDEIEVGKTIDKIVKETPQRLIVSSFSSQIGRIQQILDAAAKYGRKVFVSGRSMIDNIKISAELGYLDFPKDMVSDIKKYKNTEDKNTLILTTGSQGEAISALSRMSKNEHAHIKIKKGDTIVLSSSPIIGNEKAINTIVNQLTILGANIINNELMDVHTSGHGKQEELAKMINYIKPKYLIPSHGEFFMRKALADMAYKKCNIRPEQVIIPRNGDIVIAEKNRLYMSNEKADTKYILIDGTGEGQIGSNVQMDRGIMAQNGVLMVLIYISKKSKKTMKEPDVVSRGFVYMHETKEITQKIVGIAEKAYKEITEKNPGANRKDIKKYIRQTIDKYTHKTLERRPLIVPLIIEG
jgi:ribonuclease J